MHKRVLILGPTGTKKNELLSKIAKDLKTSGQEAHLFQFENYLKESPLFPTTFQKFLRQSHTSQAMIWDHGRNVLAQEMKNIRLATSLIETDVGWRDFKLVAQADVLGVSCPKPANRGKLREGSRTRF